MRIGVGLPNTIPGTPGRRLVDWARRAEELDFSTLSTIGRVVFPTHDELIALTAAAAVTERIRLFTNVLIEPLFDPIVLARQAASLDQISNGRFTLGLAVGWNPNDFAVVGRNFHDRGKRLDADLEVMRAVWRGEHVNGAIKVPGPRPANGESVPLAFGGNAPVSYQRAARLGVGWTAGGATPDQAAGFFAQARQAWAVEGRAGAPHLWALCYFGLGPDAQAIGEAYLTDYYGDWGPGMAAGMPRDAASIGGTAAAFAAAGADELIFVPTNADLDQLGLLHEALGGSTTVG
jgi:alkanesulfonate monooxygenase SsuD/methylene tetrahydromethanopterin reductase-like flavin-dependent oxidoreductase (luciferase family)